MEVPHDKMIMESGTLTIGNAQDSQRMTEVWKGPWSELRKLTDLQDNAVFGYKIYPGIVRPNFDETHWDTQFATPDASIPTKDMSWIVTDVQAKQEGAGDYGTLEITYETRGGDESGSGEGSGVPDGGQQRRPTTWTMKFKQYTRSPMAYAPASACNSIYQCYSNGHPATIGELSAFSISSQVTSANFKYCWYYNIPSSGKLSVGLLTDDKSKRIYDYLIAGITPQFHLPVVSRTAYFALSAGDAMSCHIEDFDKIVNLPANCPYYWRGMEWIKTEDTFTVTQTRQRVVDYQRTTSWTAAPHWDRNFYGASAWTPTVYDGN